jgi:hypothetical protein
MSQRGSTVLGFHLHIESHEGAPLNRRDAVPRRAMDADAALIIVCSEAVAAPARTPALALIIANARAVPAAEVIVRVGHGAVALTQPLAPGVKATLKLPRMTDCMVPIFAMFEDESVMNVEEFDVCQEKTVRFTD